MKLRALILPIFLILASSMVFAANIEGTIYDIELNTVKDAVVEIDTTPKQSFVSKNGTYSFDIPIGEYTITAKHEQGMVQESVIIKDDGKYNIDLILFPDFSEEVDILDESDLDIGTSYTEEINYSLYYFIGFLAALIILIAVVFNYKKKLETKLKQEIKEIKHIKKEDDLEADLKELVAFIKKEGGRTTQKDLRKNFPQSEAKISLMVSELEHKGKIKKIKKGRG
ncbi:hypothetical protein KY310_01555, partial [Candidatus Woesearchaeota archaeon]|nr:hypothetical protein [Candidatus Woesearchaeota archaeon]